MENAKILVVDDDLVMLTLTSLELEKAGYVVETAAGVSDALVFLEGEVEAGTPFQVLVTDVDMPGKSGIDLIEAAAKSGLHPDLIMVAYTGRYDDHIAAAIAAGAHAVIPKQNKNMRSNIDALVAWIDANVK